MIDRDNFIIKLFVNRFLQEKDKMLFHHFHICTFYKINNKYRAINQASS